MKTLYSIFEPATVALLKRNGPEKISKMDLPSYYQDYALDVMKTHISTDQAKMLVSYYTLIKQSKTEAQYIDLIEKPLKAIKLKPSRLKD